LVKNYSKLFISNNLCSRLIKPTKPEEFLNSINLAILTDCHLDKEKISQRITKSMWSSEMLSEHSKTGKCFHAFNGEECSGKTIFAYHLLISDNHWTLVLVDREKRTLEYYDSLNSYGNYNNNIQDHFKKLAEVLTEKDPGKTPYKFVCKLEKSLQQDGSQCGLWLLYFLEERLKNPDVNFNELDVNQSQGMIAEYRLKVMNSLIALEIEMKNEKRCQAMRAKLDMLKPQEIIPLNS